MTEPEKVEAERENPQEVPRVTIPQAGLLLGKSYNQVQMLVMKGELKGGQDEGGRWFVEQPALDEFIASQPVRD